MKLELEVLDGPQKQKIISLKNGLHLGQNTPLPFADAQMPELHSVFSIDSKNSWSIECLAPLKLRLGGTEVARATLLYGLIFHIGQTGFKVVERSALAFSSWVEGLREWILRNPAPPVSSDIFFFRNPVRLTFIQGIQFEEYFTLSYGPRVLGFNNLDLNIRDPLVPSRVAKFFQIGEQTYIENLCGERAKINGNYFDQHPVEGGDLLSIASNVIELSVLR